METSAGTISAYIKRFREQDPLPSESRPTPSHAGGNDFWWIDNNMNRETEPVDEVSLSQIMPNEAQSSVETLEVVPGDLEDLTNNLLGECEKLLNQYRIHDGADAESDKSIGDESESDTEGDELEESLESQDEDYRVTTDIRSEYKPVLMGMARAPNIPETSSVVGDSNSRHSATAKDVTREHDSTAECMQRNVDELYVQNFLQDEVVNSLWKRLVRMRNEIQRLSSER